MAPQRRGTLDLGTYCEALGLASESTCPEQGIATNGDGVTQASYSGGHLWFAISTLVSETFGTSSEIHVGLGVLRGRHRWFWQCKHALHMTSQGYVAAAHEDMEFPTLVGGTNRCADILHAFRRRRTDCTLMVVASSRAAPTAG